jgi:flagellar hook assembly protein FlgD
LPKADHLYFEVTNATGYHVKTLVDDELEAGAHEVIWDATNDDGEGISSGIYLIHLATSDYEQWMASVVRMELEDPEVD